jgi:hypothetical protein
MFKSWVVFGFFSNVLGVQKLSCCMGKTFMVKVQFPWKRFFLN